MKSKINLPGFTAELKNIQNIYHSGYPENFAKKSTSIVTASINPAFFRACTLKFIWCRIRCGTNEWCIAGCHLDRTCCLTPEVCDRGSWPDSSNI